jgi:hypothetical protein
LKWIDTLRNKLTHTDLYHALTWPELSYVAVDPQGRVVGYILSKMYVSSPPFGVPLADGTGRRNPLASLTGTSPQYQ